MRVLITGATGFLGGHMVKKLTDQGLDVTVLCRPSSDLSDLKNLKYQQIHGDVTNLSSLITATKDHDYVFHLAGLIGYSKAQRAAMELVNVQGTQNIVDACKVNRIKRLVHMSSVVAIGASFDGKTPLTEQSPFNIHHLNLGYFETKHNAEKIIVQACKVGDVDATMLNPSTIYGPADAKKGSRKTQLKVARGQFPFYTSGGVNVVNYQDVVDAIFNALEKGKTAERYILSSENITIKKLFELIAEAAGVEPPKIHLPDFAVHTLGKIGDIMEAFGKKGPLNSENAWTSTLYHWFDSSKAQKELGLRLTPAKTSIEQSVNWIKENLG